MYNMLVDVNMPLVASEEERVDIIVQEISCVVVSSSVTSYSLQNMHTLEETRTDEQEEREWKKEEEVRKETHYDP